MKVEIQCGDTITIPDGCKAIVKDGSVVFEREQKFKDGDILVSVVNRHRHDAFIYESTDKKGFHSYYIGIDVCGQLSFSESLSDRWCNEDLSYATEEEKQTLFDKMKEQGLRWNAEEKRVEKIRWRAEERKIYYYVSSEINVSSTCRPKKGEHLYDYEGNSFLSYNYFRTKEQAEEAARRMKEVLLKYHEELGE